MRRLATRVSGETRVAFFRSGGCPPIRGGWRRSPRRRGFVACRRRRQDVSALTARSAAQRSGGDGCRLTAGSVRCVWLRTPNETLRHVSRGAPLPRYVCSVPLARCRHARLTCNHHDGTPAKDGPRDHQHGRAGRSYATARGSRSGRCARCDASALRATAIFLTIPARVSARCSHREGCPLRRSAPRERRVASPRADALFQVRDAPS